MEKLGYTQKSPTKINEDNQSCIAWVYDDGSTKRAKHIALKYHYSKDMAAKGEIKVEYCPTADMIADIMTKPLGRNRFDALRFATGVRNPEEDSKIAAATF